MNYRAGSWFQRGEQNRKAQIDLVYLRADKTITVCELKYIESPVGLDVIDEMEKKLAIFPNKKQHTIERVLICATDPTQTLLDQGYFHRVLTIDDIFG